MKKKNNTLATQYNPFASKFSGLQAKGNTKTKRDMYAAMKDLAAKYGKNQKLLDLGCGEGADLIVYKELGFIPYGIDASPAMCELAKANVKDSTIRCEKFDSKTSFKVNTFDVVASKWALQTAEKIQPIYEEAYRMLKPGGHIVFLVVHPLRQFLEKKKSGKNYFEQEIVESILFGGELTVQEPTHTMSEYFSPYFFEHFSLVSMIEDYEFHDAEQIGGDIYPTYLIYVARKK